MPDATLPVIEHKAKFTLRQVAEWEEGGETKSQTISAVDVFLMLPQITALGINFSEPQ